MSAPLTESKHTPAPCKHQANARLIAAAPDLLAALLACREFWRDPSIPCPPALHDQVTSAIAKAIGGHIG